MFLFQTGTAGLSAHTGQRRQDADSSVKNNKFLTNQEILLKHEAHFSDSSGNQRNT